MPTADCLPDYPLSSAVAKRLKSALDAADDETVRDVLCTQVRRVDAVIELANDDWMKDPSAQLPPGVLVGLWTLEYKRELTTPLCIAAARGHTTCVRQLLGRGADPNASPGGRAPLHEACAGSHTDCTQLLLQHGADPDLLSAEGLAPLHLCCSATSLGCAQVLLEHGASVHCVGGTGQDTPLHMAAQHGLDKHARLYLDHGAHVDARNGHGETALSTACGALLQPEEQEGCLHLCAMLLQLGAAPDARDEDERSPLHKACGQVRLGLAHLLLRHGADAATLDYGGASPLARVLQVAACSPQASPERLVQELLNHGSPTVWPDAFPKVLKMCAAAPAVIEVLFNAYPQLRVSEAWREVIPEEVFQMHEAFYRSLFSVACSPRRLQHLCRCALRRCCGRKCSLLVPKLPLPVYLQSYLLLEPEGVLY